MSSAYEIELYTGPEWKLAGRVPFLPLVAESLQTLYGWQVGRMQIKVLIVDVPHESTLVGEPIVENLVPQFGFAYVTVTLDGHIVYQHPHPLDDLVAQRLQVVLRESAPSVKVWGYRLDLPGIPTLDLRRETPQVKNSFKVRPAVAGERPRFQIRRVEEEAPPARRLAEFGIEPDEGQVRARVKVLVSAGLNEDLLHGRHLSEQVEEGGFLIGRVYRDADSDGAFIVDVREALTAEHTGASLLHFTFTGDSFAEVKHWLRARPAGERIVGWYHTHLFPATESMGLSSIDFTLHFNTFRIEWQVAGLINIDIEHRGPERVLRFYVRDGNKMLLCPQWVTGAGDEPQEFFANDGTQNSAIASTDDDNDPNAAVEERHDIAREDPAP